MLFRSLDDAALVKRIAERVADSFQYVRDGRAQEELWSPAVHAARVSQHGRTWGDCDDGAMWCAALLRAVGGVARLAAVANGKRGQEYNHVRCDGRVGKGWMSMDFLAGKTPSLREAYWIV